LLTIPACDLTLKLNLGWQAYPPHPGSGTIIFGEEASQDVRLSDARRDRITSDWAGFRTTFAAGPQTAF
jgi:hypothetical protein